MTQIHLFPKTESGEVKQKWCHMNLTKQYIYNMHAETGEKHFPHIISFL